MKAKKSEAPATATATAFPFKPFQEGQAQLARLVDAIQERELVNVKQARAIWGFSLLIPFTKQWDGVSDSDKKRIRGEALGLMKQMRPGAAESTLNRAVLALGFRVREREKDPLAGARAFLKSAARTFHAHGVSPSDWMTACAEARAAAETKEA